MRDPLVLVGIEFGASAPTPGERLLAADEPEQDPPRDQLVVGFERTEGRLRVPRNRPADTAATRVCREGQPPPVARLPQVDESSRKQRQAAGLACHVVDERVDELRLDFEPDLPGWAFDRPAQLARAHRPEQNVVRADQIGDLRVARKLNEEVRAQRDDHERATLRVPRPLDQPGHERRALFVAQFRPEELLELVDRKDVGGTAERLRIAGTHEDVVGIERRQQSGAKKRRLPAARRADESEERNLLEPAEQLGHQTLTAEEELRICRLERRQTLEGANVAEGLRFPSVFDDSRGERGILDEDRPLQFLQLAAGLETQFVAQERAGPLVHGEPFRLASRPVERHHQLRVEMLPKRMLGSESFELGNECQLTAEREVRLDSLLDRR